jgi:hypothetical protein
MQTAMCNRLAVPAQLQRPSSLSGLRPRLAVAPRPLAIAPRAAQDGPPKTVRQRPLSGGFAPLRAPRTPLCTDTYLLQLVALLSQCELSTVSAFDGMIADELADALASVLLDELQGSRRIRAAGLTCFE